MSENELRGLLEVLHNRKELAAMTQRAAAAEHQLSIYQIRDAEQKLAAMRESAKELTTPIT